MHDHIVPSSHGLELSRILPNVESVLFEKSGHIPTLEEKEKAVFHLRKFLETKKANPKKSKLKTQTKE
jgi:pimeloyl-ACP methyl ester carboxylesterase